MRPSQGNPRWSKASAQWASSHIYCINLQDQRNRINHYCHVEITLQQYSTESGFCNLDNSIINPASLLMETPGVTNLFHGTTIPMFQPSDHSRCMGPGLLMACNPVLHVVDLHQSTTHGQCFKRPSPSLATTDRPIYCPIRSACQ